MAETLGTGRIVVGVDGSDASKEALRWAAAQARLTGFSVDAVIAWHPLVVFGMAPSTGQDFDVEGTARTVLHDTLTKALSDGDPVEVRELVPAGPAAGVLIEAASGAELLVVGNRGHGGFMEALLGSVGQHCVHHSTCPVVIVRGHGT